MSISHLYLPRGLCEDRVLALISWNTVELIPTLGALSPPRRACPGPGPHSLGRGVEGVAVGVGIGVGVRG